MRLNRSSSMQPSSSSSRLAIILCILSFVDHRGFASGPGAVSTSATVSSPAPSKLAGKPAEPKCTDCGFGEQNCDNVHQCTDSCGQIKSINYPSNYGNNHRCRWSIRAPINHYVSLKIIDFDIPSANNASKLGTCIFDYLTLIDGYTGKRLGCYCNEHLPPAYIVSPWNELIIQFDTNSETTGRGFYFKYEFKALELAEHIKRLLIPATDNANCSPGWQYFRGSCYRAFNESEPLQWYDAENKCYVHGKGLDGHLVSILDKDEMLVILYLLTNAWQSTRYRDYYIGLIDASREGVYRWSDNNPMSYTDWELRPMLLEDEMAAQPDGGAYEDCTIIRFSSYSRTSNWHDVPCSLGKHYHSHLDKWSGLFDFNYVDSYICKSDSISLGSASRWKVRRPLFSNEFKPPVENIYPTKPLPGVTYDKPTTAPGTPMSNTSSITPSPAPNLSSSPVASDSPSASVTSGGSQSTAVGFTGSSVVADEGASSLDHSTKQNNRVYLSKLDDNRYFVCDNLEVISTVLRCDGIAHCRDGSDESNGCDPDCLDWQFRCANGRCISIGHYCDFVDDCGDGSDESRCERHRCKLNEFRCQSGQCIAASQRCDLLPDCSDNSDEGRLCTIGSNCNTASTFQCYNGNCIPQYAVCDFQIDCPGKFHEDEDMATCEVILRNRSLDYNYSLPAYANHMSPTHLEIAGAWVEQNQFKCKSGNMIDANLRCLYEFDRYGYQLGCRDVSHLIDCADFECPVRDYVKCSNSYCIPWRYICDGKWDCIMGDDEVGCARYVCPGQYKCGNQSSCILLHQLCDGHRQCPMGDDEWFCDLQCPSNCDCIGQSVNCRRASLTSLSSNYISKSVRKLDLSYNRLGPNLSSSDFSAYHDLAELILRHNGIEVLIPRKFHQLRNLYKLDLSNNQIHSVKRGAFAGLRRVTQLLMESNPELVIIEPEAFLGLSSLQMLNISSSRIRALRKNTFDGLTSLRHLLLRSNMLVEIEDGAFRSLSSLVSLDMRGNEIRYFTKSIFSELKSLRNLSTDSFKFCCLMNNQIPSDKCLPLPDEISDCEDLLSSPLQRTCNWIAGGVALLGNLIVVVWRYRNRLGQKEREEEQVNSTLLLSLGCSDLLMGICQIIIAIVDSYYRGRYIENADNWRESILCNFCGFLSTVSIEASIVTLVLIARNRYTEICHPFSSPSKFTLDCTRRLILASWSLALLIATLPLLMTLYFRGQFYARSGVCLAFHITNQKAAGWLYSISDAFNLMAFVYIATCYTKIYMEISRASRRNKADRPNHPAKIALIVLTHFVACLPAVILRLMSWAGIPLPAAVYSWVAVLVLPANSAINPMIYTIPSIRHQIRLLVRNHRARKSANLAARANLHQLVPVNYAGAAADGSGAASAQLALNGGQVKQQPQLTPLLSGNASIRERLARRNIPPGYVPFKQFIRSAGQVSAEQLVWVALAVARDVEQKHKERLIYRSLELDHVFVSDKLAIGEQQQQQLSSSKSAQLSVFLADHDGYSIFKRSQCNHDHSSNGPTIHRHHRRTHDCECANVNRFGDILFKLIQLYNNRKLEQSEESLQANKRYQQQQLAADKRINSQHE